MDNEKWKDIEGYEGLYQVSNLGRVKSLKRVIRRKDGNNITYNEKILSPRDSGKGYKKVCLNKNGISKNYAIHRLVLETFSPCDNMKNLTVDHINFNRSDNRLENLRWASQSENVIYSYKNGRHLGSREGCKNGRATLSEEEVVNIRNMYNEGLNVSEIIYELYKIVKDDKEYNKIKQKIDKVVKNKTYKNVKVE